SYEPLTGATITLFAGKTSSSPVSLATNPSGEFLFENLRPGYYHCEVILQGFEPVFYPEILIAAGKEQVLEIALRRATTSLPEVTIAASVPGRRPVQPLGEIPLTRDQTLRFPAMYFDPGRLAAAYPGVAQIDDGTNHMSIRGNSPAHVRWRLEGLDVVNPNHLPNAGTFNDAPAAAGGGVLMFSAQMLDNSSLLTGAFSAGTGDAIAGVMDMHLRAGNKRTHEFTAQAGLIGLDVAAEGPIGKNQKTSYVANYRYSTVGLLGELGVSFGDEQINFQDLSFHLHSTGKKGGQYAVFALGGLSTNYFTHKSDPAEIKYAKEFYDIDFESKTGIAGASGRWKLGDKAFLKFAVAVSGQWNNWIKDNPALVDTFADYDRRREKRAAGVLEFKRLLGQSQFVAGMQANHIYFRGDVFRIISLDPGQWAFYYPYNNAVSYANFLPYLRWDMNSRNGKWSTQVGIQGHYNEAYEKLKAGGNLSIAYKLTKRHKLVLAGGLYYQDAPAWAQFIRSRYAPFIPDFIAKYMESQQAGVRYVFTPNNAWKFSVEAYLQNISHIPTNVQTNGALPYTTYNNPDIILDFPLHFDTEARNQGIEFSAERFLNEGWFMAANATIFDSKYRVESGRWFDSKWDIGHLSNLTFGKEWIREKSPTTTRTLGVGARAVWGGGPREADVDLGASVAYRWTVFNETNGYTRDYPDYFRFDIRVYWKRSLGARKNSTFALDIQNVTGQQNLAYHYWDPYRQNVENKYQLGPIPNFSWKLEF
ncbi:MAG: TonB-dependent receptor, partial [Saprospiraceae bacterium]|nr:TonB-dependent receptor [Saprospiraceae bacterium]